ncbi:MAG: peptide chain release factor N(5)-glutamine methyltransferase [Desulfomonile tiedjei]|nr:peptide chain release factor N(5)-glutamine methyltransferase [Desulfomonile tiedjei]
MKTPVRWTIQDVLAWTTDYFKKKGIPSARLDAEILLAHALGVDRLHLYLSMDRPLRPDERSQFRDVVRRRAGREPVALITGKKEFWSIQLRTVPGILIPRPDTEILVEAVVEEIRDNPTPTIMEIGTGSGAIAVAVARENPRATVVATDVNPLAVSTARLNADDAGVGERVRFVACDLFEAIRPAAAFDVICSNPPYIPRDEIPSLEPEITQFEPIRALDGGPDGLDVIRALAAQAPLRLKPGGALVLEIGETQEIAVRELFSSLAGLQEIRTLRDLAGKPRVVKGRC